MKKVLVKNGKETIEAYLIKTETYGNNFVRMLKSDEKNYGIYSTITKRTYWNYTQLGAEAAFNNWMKKFMGRN